MNPTTLMIEDTLRAVERGITTALRQLKDLEAPLFATTAGGPPGGPHRGHSMVLLRLSLHEVHRALLSHLEESGFRARQAASSPSTWQAAAQPRSKAHAL
jgi:hypothetical protein